MSKKRVFLSNEDAEQEAVIEYCDIRDIPIVHIPNEGKRSVSYASKLKRMGLRKGFPDLFVPIAQDVYHGLFIEMKYGEGKISKDQQKWLMSLTRWGYLCRVCYGFDSAVKVINEYLRKKDF